MAGYSSFIVANVPLDAQHTIMAPSSALNNNTIVMFPTDKNPRDPYRNRNFDDCNNHSSHVIPDIELKPLHIFDKPQYDDYEDDKSSCFTPIIDVKPLPILNLDNNFQDDDDENNCNRPYYIDAFGHRAYY